MENDVPSTPQRAVSRFHSAGSCCRRRNIRTSAGPAPGACAWRTQVAGAQCPGSDASVNSVITAEVVCEFGGTDHGHAARQQHAVLTALVVQGPLRGCRCLLPSPPCNCPPGSTFHHLRLGLSRHVAKRSLSQHEGQEAGCASLRLKRDINGSGFIIPTVAPSCRPALLAQGQDRRSIGRLYHKF